MIARKFLWGSPLTNRDRAQCNVPNHSKSMQLQSFKEGIIFFTAFHLKAAKISRQASRSSTGTLNSISVSISSASKDGSLLVSLSARSSSYSLYSFSTCSFFPASSGIALQTSSLRTLWPKSSAAASMMHRATLCDLHLDKTTC